ncbi:MAG: M48 family metalloprotease, partial [Spirochaetaceae bacterium]|nr:M48 family metalloprotease [Spirochaetaceae bacterium]
MFKKWSLFIPSLLLVFVVIFLLVEKPNAPKEVTFAPLFQILGKFVQTADVAFSRILSAGEWDEASFGAELKKRFDDEYEISSDSIYMNELLVDLIETSRKDFGYTVYVDQYMAPNAFAMPGGVIVFSAELLELLETEAQVASILSHEIAHIELDHCLNAFKFEMAKDKYDLEALDLFSTLYNV